MEIGEGGGGVNQFKKQKNKKNMCNVLFQNVEI
jgi:hypothetical protein